MAPPLAPPALTICMQWLAYQTPDPGDRWLSEQLLEWRAAARALTERRLALKATSKDLHRFRSGAGKILIPIRTSSLPNDDAQA